MEFFTISDLDITAMIGYTKDLVSDFMPLLVIVLGLAIAFWVIRVLFNLR